MKNLQRYVSWWIVAVLVMILVGLAKAEKVQVNDSTMADVTFSGFTGELALWSVQVAAADTTLRAVVVNFKDSMGTIVVQEAILKALYPWAFSVSKVEGKSFAFVQLMSLMTAEQAKRVVSVNVTVK